MARRLRLPGHGHIAITIMYALIAEMKSPANTDTDKLYGHLM
jgi:hypothetical protein